MVIEATANAAKATARAWVTRSGKREVSVALLAFWMFITTKVFFYTDGAFATIILGPYATATSSIFLFAGMAFGFDAYAKQIMPGVKAP